MTDILLISTAKYYQFVDQMTASIKKHIKFPHRIILLTDQVNGREDCTEYYIKHEPFPYITLFRYHYFLQLKDYSEHILYVDVDARFVEDVTEEILGDLIAVRHCGFYFANRFPHEENPRSPLYGYRFNRYYGGGLQGGSREEYLKACKWCMDKINEALDSGLVPETSFQRYTHNKNVALRHHDETAWNCYLSGNEPTVELSPEYHFPETTEYFRINCWEGNVPWKPKLLLLDKNHEEIRS